MNGARKTAGESAWFFGFIRLRARQIFQEHNTEMTNTVIRMAPRGAARRRYQGPAAPQAPVFHGDVDTLVARLQPSRPVYTLRPDMVEATARHFRAAFPGRPMYAVKTNPHDSVIAALIRGGFDAFDVASLEEVKLVRKISSTATLYFMHPVKSPEAIRAAYTRYGVRAFVFDCEDELHKILRETGYAKDLSLFVRVALPKNTKSAIDFSSKFGALPDDAARLAAIARPFAKTLGISFHVGTQIAGAAAYGAGIDCVAAIMARCGVTIDTIDVGGGFPVPYPGQEDVPTLEDCVAAMTSAIARNGLEHMPLLAEPGRYMVALSGSLIVRVELRKGDVLYINDGTYGGLFDAGAQLLQRFPVRAVRPGRADDLPVAIKDFRFAGPTCDSLDMMDGPFTLPADIAMGDWIEIAHAGAYSACTRTNFNGFGAAETICLFAAASSSTPTLKTKGPKNDQHRTEKRQPRQQPQICAAE